MRLIRLFSEPYEAFSELQNASWVPAFVACMALSLLSNLVVVNAIGVAVIMRRFQSDAGLKTGGSAVFAGLYAAQTGVMLIGLLTISIVMWVVLNLRRSSVPETGAETGAGYRIVFTICSYAAYARETVRLIITLVVVSWRHFSRVPLAYAGDIKTNAAAFLNVNTARPLFNLAKSLDALMFGFLALVAIGLWKTIPNLRLQRANEVVLLSWLIYVALAVTFGR
jgi:hypothetical protein